MTNSYTRKDLFRRFNVKSPNTFTNWERKEGFPKHMRIGCKAYWDADQVDEWYRKRLRSSQNKTSPAKDATEGEENAS